MATHKNAITTWGEIQVITSPQAYNIAGNYTPVKYTFQLVRTATNFGGYWSNNTSTAKLSINGTAITVPNFTYDFRTNYTKVLATGTINIPHNADGTKTFAITASTTTADLVPNGSLSENETLTRIPRTSTFTIPTSFTMGSAFTVSISRADSSFTHWVRLSDGSVSLFDTDSTVGTSQSVNVALSTLAARSPNAMSRAFTVTVWTYSGGAIIGSTSKNITANVPSTVKPTFSAVTVSENVSTVKSLVGAYVQTKSKLNLAITGASGIHGSTIKSYNITGVGHNVNSSSTVTGILSVSGNQTIKGTVIDSRGQSFERSVVVNILPYTAPTLSNLSFKRTLSDKTEAPLGDNVTVRAKVKVQSLIVNGVQKNSIKYQVQSAKAGGSFADKANTTSTGLTKSYSDSWVGYSVDYAYNFRVRAGDVFGFGGWSVGVIPTGVVTQQWGSKTTSFGKMIDNTSYNVQVGTGGIQSDGPGYFLGQLNQNNGQPIEDFNTFVSRAMGSTSFNNIWKHGIYRYANTSQANSAVGSPGTGAGWLVVRTLGDYTNMTQIAGVPWCYAVQEYTNLSGVTATRYYQTDANGGGSWSNWKYVSYIPNVNLPIKDYVIEEGSNYTKWNSGKLEQWGVIKTANLPASTTSLVSVTFPRPFVAGSNSENISIFPSIETGSPSARHIGYTAVSNTKFSISVYHTGNTTWFNLSWKAIGRWK